MDKLIAAVGRRINPSGVKELTIRQYGAEQIEVIIPEVEEREVEQIKKQISTSGLLEFRIVANQADDKESIKAGNKTTGRDVYIGGRLVGRWVKAGPELSRCRLGAAVSRNGRRGAARSWSASIRSTSTARYLTRAVATASTSAGGLAVDFSFDADGRRKVSAN